MLARVGERMTEKELLAMVAEVVFFFVIVAEVVFFFVIVAEVVFF